MLSLVNTSMMFLLFISYFHTILLLADVQFCNMITANKMYYYYYYNDYDYYYYYYYYYYF